jgi:hypothetical protein
LCTVVTISARLNPILLIWPSHTTVLVPIHPSIHVLILAI